MLLCMVVLVWFSPLEGFIPKIQISATDHAHTKNVERGGEDFQRWKFLTFFSIRWGCEPRRVVNWIRGDKKKVDLKLGYLWVVVILRTRRRRAWERPAHDDWNLYYIYTSVSFASILLSAFGSFLCLFLFFKALARIAILFKFLLFPLPRAFKINCISKIPY